MKTNLQRKLPKQIWRSENGVSWAQLLIRLVGKSVRNLSLGLCFNYREGRFENGSPRRQMQFAFILSCVCMCVCLKAISMLLFRLFKINSTPTNILLIK
jgi:hypothetical protein